MKSTALKTLFMQSTATFSACQQYRYRLTRTWDNEVDPIAFVMLNPSTATAEVDDPTIRRCMGFARLWNAGGVVIYNLFALRATDPRELYKHADPVGEDNDSYLTDLAATGPKTILAWGCHGGLRDRGEKVVALLSKWGKPLYCLGKTGGGYPKHPLYLKKHLEPEFY